MGLSGTFQGHFQNYQVNKNLISEYSEITKGIMKNAVHELRDNVNSKADTNGVVDSDIDVLIVLMVPGRKEDIIY